MIHYYCYYYYIITNTNIIVIIITNNNNRPMLLLIFYCILLLFILLSTNPCGTLQNSSQAIGQICPSSQNSKRPCDCFGFLYGSKPDIFSFQTFLGICSSLFTRLCATVSLSLPWLCGSHFCLWKKEFNNFKSKVIDGHIFDLPLILILYKM